MFKKYLWVFFISMLPIVELRGSIPVGVAMGLDIIPTYIFSVIGNLLPVPFILLFLRRVLEWMKTTKAFAKIAIWLESKANKHKHKIVGKDGENTAPDTTVECEDGDVSAEDGRQPTRKKAIMRSAAVGLFFFVAIPLPGTGAWTGSLIATLVDMRMRYALPAIILGVLTAGVIMSLASLGLLGFFNFLAN